MKDWNKGKNDVIGSLISSKDIYQTKNKIKDEDAKNWAALFP